LIAERRAKLAALRAQGPAFPNDFRRDALAADLLSTYQERDAAWLEANPVRVRVGGRMMFKRLMGKASFCQARRPERCDPAVSCRRRPWGRPTKPFKGYDVGDNRGRRGPAVFAPAPASFTVRGHRIEVAGQISPAAARQVARASQTPRPATGSATWIW